VIQAGGIHSELVLMAAGAFLFYVIDTMLVATVVALVQGKPLSTVWNNCHLWAFPYYLVGAILLDVVVAMETEWRLRAPLMALPLMMLVHAFYRNLVSRFSEAAEKPAVTSA
jgi:hypothetical protein